MPPKARNGFASKQLSDEESNRSGLIFWALYNTHLSFITSVSDFHSLNILCKKYNECTRSLAQIS